MSAAAAHKEVARVAIFLDPFGEFAVAIAVPEPGGWMLLAAGFAVVGFCARVRHRRLATG